MIDNKKWLNIASHVRSMLFRTNRNRNTHNHTLITDNLLHFIGTKIRRNENNKKRITTRRKLRETLIQFYTRPLYLFPAKSFAIANYKQFFVRNLCETFELLSQTQFLRLKLCIQNVTSLNTTKLFRMKSESGDVTICRTWFA